MHELAQNPRPTYSLFRPVINEVIISIGNGKMIVEFFSSEIAWSVCKVRKCIAPGDCEITSAASFNARLALCSPSAAITYK